MTLATPSAFTPLPSSDSLPEPDGELTIAGQITRDYLTRIRAEMRTRHDAGEGGRSLVAAYTDAIDRLVRFLYADATTHFLARNPRINHRCTVLAQGGYGRGELNAQSDIDLLFLYPWKVNPFVETVAEVMLFALWDAGLAVGHAVRNVRECARLAARDMKVKTAVLDGRFLCGDEPLYAEFEEFMLEETASQNPTPFFKEKLAENVERHARAGDSVYLLQPQVKEGQGGLRDLHTALWMAKVKYKVRTFRDLVRIGVVSEADVDELDAAIDFLWRVRNGMHFEASKHQDHLTFELQERLAPALGFGPGRAGTEAFMRTYYGHAATVNRFSESVIARCVQTAEPYRGSPLPLRTVREGMRVQGRTLSVVNRHVFLRDPAALVHVFVEAQRHGATLSSETRDLIRECAPSLEPVAGSAAVAAAFLAVLRARGHVYDTLVEMHKLGVLKRVVPEFARLECLIAHDPFHIYTVDYHSLMGVRELERLRAGDYAKEVPLLTQVMREVHQPELLFLAMIFHDVGKGHGHDHDSRGAGMVRDMAARLGLNEDQRAACEFLVRNHLLMSHLAQRRDVQDDGLVSDFSRTVETVENLQRLYLLTFADMRAVGPQVWNNWRDSLLRELYTRTKEAFDTGDVEPDARGGRLERIRSRVIEAVLPDRQAAATTFLASMPDSYILSTPEEVIPSHSELRRRFGEREAAGERPAMAIHVAHFPERDFSEFAVCTRDRPGLFAMLSGVLAAHSMNILAARIATSLDGIALDAFRISQPSGEASLDEERWERVEHTLRRVLGGEVDIEELVRRAQRPSLLARPRRRAPTSIEIDNSVSRDCTVLDVYTGDRVGLLFTITNCLYHLWLEIRLAKITTMVDRVLDVFYVTDHEGRKIEDEARLTAIQTELTRALEADGSGLGAMLERLAEGGRA